MGIYNCNQNCVFTIAGKKKNISPHTWYVRRRCIRTTYRYVLFVRLRFNCAGKWPKICSLDVTSTADVMLPTPRSSSHFSDFLLPCTHSRTPVEDSYKISCCARISNVATAVLSCIFAPFERRKRHRPLTVVPRSVYIFIRSMCS